MLVPTTKSVARNQPVFTNSNVWKLVARTPAKPKPLPPASKSGHTGTHADCGYAGIPEADCVASGQCAFNGGLVSEPTCFWKVDCVEYGTEEQCNAKGCTWDPEGSKGNGFFCYHSNSKPLPLGVQP